MNYYVWSDLSVGMSESFRVTITTKMMEWFLEITGDTNPLHNDERYAVENGFPGKVVYGMLTSSFVSTLAGVYLPGRYSLIQSVELKLARPVFIGDELLVQGTITELNNTVEQMVIGVSIINQNEEKVLRGKMKVGLTK